MWKKLSGRLDRIAAVVFFLRSVCAAIILWWVIAALVHKPLLLPYPGAVWTAWIGLLTSGSLWRETSVSFQRLVIGYCAGAVVGSTVGVVMGRWKLAEDLGEPVVESVRAIPGIAWIPIALLWFGVGNLLPIFIIFYGAVFPFILNAQKGIMSVDRRLVLAAINLGASKWQIIRDILLPSSVPYLLAGARVGLGLAWMSIIAAELLAAPSGLGFSIENSRYLQQTPAMLAWVLWVGIIGYALDIVVRIMFRRLAPWAFATRLGEAA